MSIIPSKCSTEQIYVFGIIASNYVYWLGWRDWGKLAIASRDVYEMIKKHCIFNFSSVDRSVFENVRISRQTHALYHANTAPVMERIFQMFGYSPEDDNCTYCEICSHSETPIKHALLNGTFEHFEKIFAIGLSRKDKSFWAIMEAAIESLDSRKFRLIWPANNSNEGGNVEIVPGFENVDILSIAANMSDDIVEACIDFVLSLGIDVNSIDYRGNNVLYITTVSPNAISCLYSRGLNLTSRNHEGEDIIDWDLSLFVRYINGEFTPEFLGELKDEVETLQMFPEFVDDERISDLLEGIRGELAAVTEQDFPADADGDLAH